MEVEVRVEEILVEGVDQWGLFLGDMGITEVLAHHGTLVTFHQGVVIGVACSGLGELDQQLVEQLRDPFVEIFRAVVGVNALDEEREGSLFQSINGPENQR